MGGFPVGWSEWNGRFRDVQRDFWRGTPGQLSGFAALLTGTAEALRRPGRAPSASINFVTCHDGFTLADLVSFEHKRNLANGEDNRDGTDDNRSWNCGVEGETGDAGVRALRARVARSHVLTLLLAQGTPMLVSGDEALLSHAGNNNWYGHDGPLAWFDWGAAEAGADPVQGISADLARHVAPGAKLGLMLHHAVMTPVELEGLAACLAAWRAHPNLRCVPMRALLRQSQPQEHFLSSD